MWLRQLSALGSSVQRKLTIDAPGASRLRRYIQSATLDGKQFEQTWLPSQKVHDGGRLTFAVGPQANTAWAAEPEAAPPSA
jgi:putative alpha-1,2-mannosidase